MDTYWVDPSFFIGERDVHEDYDLAACDYSPELARYEHSFKLSSRKVELRRRREVIECISIQTGCVESFAQGISTFKNELLGDDKDLLRYSITSRPHSIWRLVAKHLDEPFERFIELIDRQATNDLLREFLFSKICLKEPPIFFDQQTGCVAQRSEPTRRSTHAKESFSSPLRYIENMRLWQRNLDAATQDTVLPGLLTLDAYLDWNSVLFWIDMFGAVGPSSGCKNGWVGATLDTAERLIGALQGFVPYRYKAARMPTSRLSFKRHGDQQANFCDLCWHFTALTARKVGCEKHPSAIDSRLSNKFCAAHDSSLNPAAYRKAHRRRDAFHRQLAELTALDSSGLQRFQLDEDASDQDLRKKAYQLVCSKPQYSPSLSRTRRRELLTNLMNQGLNQSEIASRLNITKQAVSKFLKSTPRSVAEGV